MSHTRWFRRLLKLFPADFQADYAIEMERTFRDQHRDAARDRRAVARLWLETLADLLRTAPREHADQLAQDVRYACRAMARRPGLSTVAALVFAVGIAATTAVFSVVQAAILRPIPFDDADRLVAVREQTPEEPRPWELSYVSYLELRRDATSFEHLAAYMRNGIRIGGPEPELTDAALISANLLETLRVRPLVGRSFTPCTWRCSWGGFATACRPSRHARKQAHGCRRSRAGSPPPIRGTRSCCGRSPSRSAPTRGRR